MKRIFLITLLSFGISVVNAQSLAINTDGSTANSSAMVDVKSTIKGMLIPRMSKAQRNAIATPGTGLLVYQNAPDSTGFYYYDGGVWQWLNTANQNNENWKLNGNNGTNPTNHFIGTNDSVDLAFRINNSARMLLSTEGELGIGENNPKYVIDVKAPYTFVNNCTNNGLRIKKPIAPNDCDKGLLIGYSSPAFSGDNDALIWNYGNTVTGNSNDYNLIFGNQNSEYMRLTGGGFLGLGQIAPNYKIDADLDNAAPFNNPCIRNGLRLNFRTESNACDKGIFLGFDNVNIADDKKISLWNFTSNPTAANQYIRFGFGPDFGETDPSIGEAIRILPPGQGIGVGIQNPQAMIHIRNNLGGGIQPGVMVSAQGLPSNERGFFSGIGTIGGNSSTGVIWNYQNAPTIFGTNNEERMRVSENGYVGIGEPNPNFPLNFQSAFGDKISLWGNSSNHYGFGVQAGLLQVHSANNGDDIVFGYGNSNSFTENMRIKGNGNVGIGTSNPGFPLNFPDVLGDKISLWGNSGNHYGFGIQGFLLQIHSADITDDIAFGYGSSASFSENMRITGSGNVGIGTNAPTQKLHVIGNILATGTITPSDVRYKKGIQPITNSLEKLQQLNGVTYLFNQTAFPEWQFDDKMQYGLIAQEVEKVFPEMVKTINEKGYKGVDYVKLIPVLLEAIKELKKENNQQQHQIDHLLKAGGNQK